MKTTILRSEIENVEELALRAQNAQLLAFAKAFRSYLYTREGLDDLVGQCEAAIAKAEGRE